MQKNKIILALVLGMIISPTLVIQAATTTTPKTDPTTQTQLPNNNGKVKPPSPEKLAEMRAKLMAETAILKKNLDARKIEIEKNLKTTGTKKKLDSNAQSKVITILDSIFNKLNNQVGKLTQVDNKITFKINAASTAGMDVTAAKAQQVIAKAALDKAISEVFASRTVAINQTTTETSKETIRSLVKSSENNINTAAGEYRKLLPLIEKLNVVTKVDLNTLPAAPKAK